jgi:hypothetical protein
MLRELFLPIHQGSGWSLGKRPKGSNCEEGGYSEECCERCSDSEQRSRHSSEILLTHSLVGDISGYGGLPCEIERENAGNYVNEYCVHARMICIMILTIHNK